MTSEVNTAASRQLATVGVPVPQELLLLLPRVAMTKATAKQQS